MFVGAILLLIASACREFSPSEPANSTNGFLHTNGTQIVDEDGASVTLRGINLEPFPFWSFKDISASPYSQEEINAFNLALLNHYITDDDFRILSSMGVNVVRKQISFYSLETAPYKYNDGVLKQIDYLIDLGRRFDIQIIISLTNAAQNTAQIDNQRYYSGNPYLWTDNEWKRRVVAAWEYIATRYSDEPIIVGYDIINEPTSPSGKELKDFYSEVITTVRAIDANHIIILERQHFDNTDEILFGGHYDDKNIMLSLHYYEDIQGEGTDCNPNSNYSSRDELIDLLDEFLSNNEIVGRPLYVGEFGATSLPCVGNRALEWTEDIMDIMNNRGIHYTYFSYKNIWGSDDPKSSLYYPSFLLFDGWRDQPLETQIEYIEQKVDDLETTKWTSNKALRQILEEKY